jgi:predicted MFS family arabinose efflux permease
MYRAGDIGRMEDGMIKLFWPIRLGRPGHRSTTMTVSAATSIAGPAEPGIASRLITLFAVAGGLIVANVYYSQPIAGPIAASLGLPPEATGLIVTATQAGFVIGLLFIVPLGDLIENRRLVLVLIGVAAVALLSAGLSSRPAEYLLAAALIGLSSVAVQVLVPFAAHLAPEPIRGRVVGSVMSGLMIGIMLARPIAGFVTQIASWHTVFYMSAAAMGVVMLSLHPGLPRRVPVARTSYVSLLKSMGLLALRTRVLQRRAAYQACLFAAFSLFWTTVPLLLTGPTFGMSQGRLALFALVGGAGAIAAPLAGHLADRGHTRPATALAILAVGVAFLLTRLRSDGSAFHLATLIAAAIVLDFGMTANLAVGQRAIFMLGAEFRSRLNGLYLAAFFAGGAIGSSLGGWAYATGGWGLASATGCGFAILVFGLFLTEFVQRKTASRV